MGQRSRTTLPGLCRRHERKLLCACAEFNLLWRSLNYGDNITYAFFLVKLLPQTLSRKSFCWKYQVVKVSPGGSFVPLRRCIRIYGTVYSAISTCILVLYTAPYWCCILHHILVLYTALCVGIIYCTIYVLYIVTITMSYIGAICSVVF